MEIRRFEEKDFLSLVEFNSNVFNSRDKIAESINYRFFENPYAEKSAKEILIAQDKNEKIVGQILVMPTFFSLDDKIYPAFYGMDFFVNIENRNSLTGVILVNKFKDLSNTFGIGLNDTSLAIFKAFNYKIIGFLPKYLRINNIFSLLRTQLSNKGKTNNSYSFPDSICVNASTFKRVYNAEEIISKDGYWNTNLLEFTRSKEFIAWRFFYYPGKYVVYKFLSTGNNECSKPTFFVVRPIVWKKLNCLLLVDYRFDVLDTSMFSEILQSTVRLSKKLKMTGIITGCSLPSCEKKLKHNWFFKFGRKLEIVTKFQNGSKDNKQQTDTILITFADSDCDFYYGSDKW